MDESLKELLDKAFPNTPIVPVKRTTWDIYGPPGSFKSGLVGSFTEIEGGEPLMVVNFDRPWEYIRSLYPNKYISIIDVGVTGDLDEFSAVTAYNQVKQFRDAALKINEGTFCIDGGTQFWTLMKMVILAPIARERAARGKELMPFDNDKANAEMLNWLGLLSRSNLNVVFTHQAGNVWETDEGGRNPHPTDRFYAKESSQMSYGAEIQILTYLDLATNGKNEKVPWAMITKAGFQEGVLGMTFEKPHIKDLLPWVMPL